MYNFHNKSNVQVMLPYPAVLDGGPAEPIIFRNTMVTGTYCQKEKKVKVCNQERNDSSCAFRDESCSYPASVCSQSMVFSLQATILLVQTDIMHVSPVKTICMAVWLRTWLFHIILQILAL